LFRIKTLILCLSFLEVLPSIFKRNRVSFVLTYWLFCSVFKEQIHLIAS